MVGIALAGGGARGAAHVGILQAFEEHGIVGDAFAGTSAGSFVAAAKAFGYSNGFIKGFLSEVNMSMMDYDYWGVLRSLPHGLSTIEAITKGNKLREFLRRHYNQDICNSPHPLGIVSADINTGAQIIFASQELTFPTAIDNDYHVYAGCVNLGLDQMLYASAALPGIFPPLHFDNRKLVDGSLVNCLPADILSGLGAQKIIAIDLGSDPKPPVGIPHLLVSTINTLIDQTNFLSLENAPNSLYLNCNLGNITVLEFNRAGEAYNMGYQYGLSAIEQAKAFLAS